MADDVGVDRQYKRVAAMTETLFVIDKRNYRECQNAFRGATNQEYYLGDYSIDSGSVIEVRADKKAVGSCSIIRMQAKTRQFFRRSWSHIREDGTDVTVLWFVKRGRLCISHQRGQSIAESGDFAITQSTAPFSIECQADESSLHEVLHVIVPTHLFRRFVPLEIKTGLVLPADSREFQIAERMLSDIFDDGGELAEHIEQLLVDSALAVLGEAIKRVEHRAPARQTLSEKRLQDVLRFIDVHLSDSTLSIATVAKGCGISPRYLSFLLQLNGTPFSDLVWDKRLKIASSWLASAESADIPISEIAYRVGFKSPAHFSRMFKRVFNMGPREYRLSAPAVSLHEPIPAPTRKSQEFIGAGPASLQ